MYKFSFFLVWLACVGHGRRIQSTALPPESSSPISSQEQQANGKTKETDTHILKDVFSELLQAYKPTADFNPSSLGARSAAHTHMRSSPHATQRHYLGPRVAEIRLSQAAQDDAHTTEEVGKEVSEAAENAAEEPAAEEADVAESEEAAEPAQDSHTECPEVEQEIVLSPAGIYCTDAEKCTRRKTRTVYVGDVPVGSEHPIVTQTMATTPTDKVEDTVEQIKRCADSGIDVVRLTVQGMKEARACEHIKARLLEDGYTTPLVADIHFTPKVALAVADHVDKIRVNPGNFADGRKSFDTLSELSEEDLKEAQQEIEDTLTPLVLKLKEQGKAMRIGVNHGSLSERILFQFGDSPEGMVASAVEFGTICRKLDFHNFIFSMKASNPRVMVQAYRALAKEMYKRGWDYPLHLGVTEAGGGADGRIKSAAGIGTLLLDGLGDTIRVSLTEDPEYETAPCSALAKIGHASHGKGIAPFTEPTERRQGFLTRRQIEWPLDVPLNEDGSVISKTSVKELESLSKAELCDRFGLRLRKDGDVQKDWKSIDVAVIDEQLPESLAETVQTLLDVPMGFICREGSFVPDGVTVLLDGADVKEEMPFRLGGYALVFNGDETEEVIQAAVEKTSPRLMFLRPESQEAVTFVGRRFVSQLLNVEPAKAIPLMYWFRYPPKEGQDNDALVVQSCSEYGSLFLDGLGEGLLWDAEAMTPDELREASFNLLQASRMRISKTEFISCPSCGRTLFDLQETTAQIQERTGHLPGVRIAVMGCIVNGPGEMADADFGYVGSAPGKIDLYVNYNCVKRGITKATAVDELIELIKENGRWQDPATEEDEEDEEMEEAEKELATANA